MTTDRAQFTTPASVRLLTTGLIGAVVLAIVVREMLTELPPPDGKITEVCGFCGCGPCPEWWWTVVGIVVAIGAVSVTYNLLLKPLWE